VALGACERVAQKPERPSSLQSNSRAKGPGRTGYRRSPGLEQWKAMLGASSDRCKKLASGLVGPKREETSEVRWG
jgi:hypothetical protein